MSEVYETQYIDNYIYSTLKVIINSSICECMKHVDIQTMNEVLTNDYKQSTTVKCQQNM